MGGPAAPVSKRSARPNHKRKRLGDGGGRSGEDLDDAGSTRMETHQDEDHKTLACPFYKFNPRKYHRCSTMKLRDIPRLKQHIMRSHCITGPLCPICEKTLGEPAVHGDCERSLGRDYLTEGEMENLVLTVVARGRDVETKWYSLWNHLFHKHPRPESPYVKDGLDEVIDLFNREGEQLSKDRVIFRVDNNPRRPDPDVVSEIGVLQTPQPAPERMRNTLITDSGYGTIDYTSKGADRVDLDGSRQTEQRHSHPTREGLETEIYAASEYSNTTSLRDPSLSKYVACFADELYGSLSLRLGGIDLDKLSPTIEGLLRVFALQIGSEGATAFHRNVMYLVHRYRSTIVAALYDKLTSETLEDHHSEQSSQDSDGDVCMNTDEKMLLLWNDSVDFSGDPNTNIGGVSDDEVHGVPDDDIPVDPEELPSLEKYRGQLNQDPVYQWLVARVASAIALETPGPTNAEAGIRDVLTAHFDQRKHISRRKVLRAVINFDIDWRIAAFHREQQYSCPLDQVLEQAITLTGFGNDVQATTCLEYVMQTWGSSGLQLLRLLQQAILDVGEVQSAALPCTTVIDVTYYSDDIFRVRVSGNPYTGAEVGGQLGWLAASLRSSPQPSTGATYCTPVVSIDDFAESRDMPTETSDHLAATCQVTVGVRFDGAQDGTTFSPTQGSCWQKAFRNPVVVLGYPIPRRSEAGCGLEVSVGIMASLVNAKYQIEFGGRSVLKGFSTMLTVSKVVESTVFWHLLYNEDGGYISYEDSRVPSVQAEDALLVLRGDALNTHRHILGWCEKFQSFAGSPGANYDIGWSGLRDPHQSFAWDKISISGGKFVTVGAGLSIGIKDKPAHISYEDDYISTVDMIAEKYFVFYDLDDRRAWLLDGASALLHLLRAFIRHTQSNRRMQHVCLFDSDEFQDDEKGFPPDVAAFRVLVNEQNQLHPLWKQTSSPIQETAMERGAKLEEKVKTSSTYFCIKDKVLQICRVLQQITAHQDDFRTRDGVGSRIRLTPRRQLEGFDFMDIATNQGTMWPNVAEIQATGAGWVDFTRAIRAVTLFGTNFGELLKPVGGPCQRCMCNVSHAHGKDLLAVTVAALQDITIKRGSNKTNAWRVVDTIHWHVPDKAFERCDCSPFSTLKHDRVQLLLPKTFPRFSARGLKSPAPMPDEGAVLFGHSWKLPISWGAFGCPTEGDPDCAPGETGTGTPFQDSGLGSSITSSGPERSRSGGEETRHFQGPFTGAGTSSSGMYLHPNQGIE